MNKGITVNILFCGTGGQGVLSAAEVCGWAALFQGYHVKKSEVHGMAQRGGSVESHLRFGGQVFSPLIPYGQADFLVAFDSHEAVRLKGFLRPRGIDFTSALARAQKEMVERRYLNTYILGILAQKIPLGQEHWIRAFEVVFGAKDFLKNKEIFLNGKGAT